jgi:mRNA interferase MazF
MVKPRQGDIYWVRFGFARNSGPAGKRPALVIQNDLLNMSGNVRLRKGLGNIPKTSVVVVSQMATVDKTRLLEKIGTLDKETIEEIHGGCQMVISPTIF